MIQHDDDVPEEFVEALRDICMGLPDAYEEQAWVGTRWRVRGRTFAHVLTVVPDVEAAYARVVGADEEVTVVTFRAPAEELDALVAGGPPFFKARWGRDVVVLALVGDVDWTEVAELMTESYCLLAPKKLVALVRRPS
ncbi:MmcQ/YjbR family DNA-binding protein [Jiangella alba]|uniref:Predicted DNA-binding protein, MmcQ/YjbR family n=1 Tax=Jiangella alba TaxID=561176 RepID=A0A1H5PT49_9ACTN|nr:MmcQ/YjbR family DNA-binding protein [Jiangella alba]SEF17030.1 Predicted DNA-binding protein, MmcQ/YjbR family [Jiangella alba]